MAQSPSHRYALRPGFIGPLTRKQTLNRAHNQKKREREKARGPRHRVEIASDTYYDTFVDGRGW